MSAQTLCSHFRPSETTSPFHLILPLIANPSTRCVPSPVPVAVVPPTAKYRPSLQRCSYLETATGVASSPVGVAHCAYNCAITKEDQKTGSRTDSAAERQGPEYPLPPLRKEKGRGARGDNLPDGQVGLTASRRWKNSGTVASKN